MVYEQELYNQFTYKQDKPHFHSFPGDVSFLYVFGLWGGGEVVGKGNNNDGLRE